MQQSQVNKPRKLNLDVSPKYLGADECYYKLNVQNEINPNASNDGASIGIGTSVPANYPICEMEQPIGENYSNGTFDSKRTNETYNWNINSNGVNYISRINASGKCEVVYVGDCLQLSADPKHSIKNFRAWMRVEKICSNRDGKQLIWVDGKHGIGMIDTEASIATNYFTTPFFQRCADPCAYISMCVPEIRQCISGEFVPLPKSEVSLTNNLVDVPIQVMIRHVYYDGRASEWSDRSSTYYQDSKGCFDTSDGFSRCLKFRIPIGNPLVDKIEFAFSKDGGNSWLLADTIEKYKKYNSAQEKWYERDLSEVVNNGTYSDTDCSFDYIFCNDKQCQTIDAKEFSRVRNPIPRNPQGILEIENSIGFYNYIDGVCPLDKTEVEKFNVNIDCSTPSCQQEFSKITVRAILHNFYLNSNQFIWRFGGSVNSADDTSDPAWFGGVEFSGLKNTYGQTFKDKRRNFIVYIDGQPYNAEMKQKIAGQEAGVVPSMDDSFNVLDAYQLAQTFGYYQEAEIIVPKGTKGFLRIGSHTESNVNQDKSTFVVGTLNFTNYRSGVSLNSVLGWTPYNKEIYFDTCDGDVDIQDAFIIQDNANPSFRTDRSSIAYSGYIKDKFNTPLEGLEIWVRKDGGSHEKIAQTDFNGFYSFSTRNVDLSDGQIRAEQSCDAFSSIKPFFLQGAAGTLTQRDYVIDNAAYLDTFYQTVKVPVVDCDLLPVAGLRISFSGSKFRTTDVNGIATFKVRNYSTRNRQYRAILVNNNGCISQDCLGNCSPCILSATGVGETCFNLTPELTLQSIVINKDSINQNKKGLKSGGNYPFGIVVEGDCGMSSAVYELPQIFIPKTQEKNNFSFCNLTYNGAGIKLPSWANVLKIVRGENLNKYELQWLVDKIERTNDGKIVLTIQSLNDYNAKYFFKTNTKYQWLKNDRVEFIRNGDGKIFDVATFGILNYQTISPFNDEQQSGVAFSDDAEYFNQIIITDDGKLGKLKEGALIELQRSKECLTEPAYFEICASIPLQPIYNSGIVTHTELVYPTGEFSTFDTFLVNRIIGKFPSQIFEHTSPSDFWGDKVTDTGKVHFVNKYENERRYGRNISINSTTQFNYFGDLVKTFDAPVQGDIVAMDIKDASIILAICEHDNFIAQAANDLLRVGNDGVIRALPQDSIISQPQSKIIGQYGCQYPHIGSIFFGDGYATFADVNNHAYIIHNYQFAKVAGESADAQGGVASKCNTYYRKRFQEIENYNRSQPDYLNHYRFATGINIGTRVVMLTIKTFRQPSVNNEIAPYLKGNETTTYNPATDDFLGFLSFTPEQYANIDLFDGSGCAMVTYFNSIPYVHPLLSGRFNEFYGVACDQHIGIAINKFPEKVKIPISFELQDSTLKWFVSDVRTDDPNFKSEIPPRMVVESEAKWNGSFLRDINSKGGLFNGKNARGYYTKVLFTRDNTINDAYGSIDDNKRVKYSEIDLILFKFQISEQSGFSANL